MPGSEMSDFVGGATIDSPGRPSRDGSSAWPPADFYETLFARRDVRAQFAGGTIDSETLTRVLTAAHAAPSVGLSQPWDFILVTDTAIRTQFQAHVEERRDEFAAKLSPERAAAFSPIKIEGILEAATGIVVTCDPRRGAPRILGADTITATTVYSVCLAIQNLWLAATAEGLGVGWVSFFEQSFLTELVGLPEPVFPVAWLCVGPISHRETTPDLERLAWAARLPLEKITHRNRW